MVGLLAGTLSSIFLATPVLVDLKMRDPKFRQQAARVAARRAKDAQSKHGAEPHDDQPDLADDAVLAGELRRERAVAAAAGVPARAAGRRAPAGRGGRVDRSARPSAKRRR